MLQLPLAALLETEQNEAGQAGVSAQSILAQVKPLDKKEGSSKAQGET